MEISSNINEITDAIKNVINFDNNMMSNELQSQNNNNLINLLKEMDKISTNPLSTNIAPPQTQTEGFLENTLGIPQNKEFENVPNELTQTMPSNEINNGATTTTSNNDHNVSNNNYNSNNKTIKIYNFNTLSEKNTSNLSSSLSQSSPITNDNVVNTSINNVQKNSYSTNDTQILQTLINMPIVPDQIHRLIKVRLYSVLDLYKNQNIYNQLLFCHQDLHNFVSKKWELYNQNYSYYLQSVEKQQHYNLIFKNVITFCQQISHPTLYLQIFIIYHIVKYISLENFQTQPEQEICLLQLRLGFLISNFINLCYYAYTIKKMYLIQNNSIETLLTIKYLHLNYHVHNFQSLYQTQQKLNNIGINLYKQINGNNFKIIFNLQVYNFISNFLQQY